MTEDGHEFTDEAKRALDASRVRQGLPPRWPELAALALPAAGIRRMLNSIENPKEPSPKLRELMRNPPPSLVAQLSEAHQEIARLNERLENDHVFDLAGNRVEVTPGSIPDGIDARDETIKILDKNVDTLRVQNERLRQALSEIAGLCGTDPANPFLADRMARIATATLATPGWLSDHQSSGVPGDDGQRSGLSTSSHPQPNGET